MGMRGALPRVVFVCALAALAAACSGALETAYVPPDSLPSVSVPGGNGVYKIGHPYAEDGIDYVPHVQPDYDETGIASWYGPSFHRKRTANGEVFDSGALTAAHPTLPMPVNVRVTNLENGRSLVLRVNDRGPFAHNRIIDVSARAAELLGFRNKGTAKVRVTYLSRADVPGSSPVETPAAVATAVAAVPTAPVQMAALDPVAAAPSAPGETAAADADPPVVDPPQPVPAVQSETPAGETDAPPQSDPPASDPSASNPPASDPPPAALAAQPSDTVAALPASASAHIWIQAGTFAVRDNAERLKDVLSAQGNVTISSIDRNGRVLYRVRIGPFDDVGAADAALARLDDLGTSGAKVIAEQ